MSREFRSADGPDGVALQSVSAALRESEERLRLVIDNLPAPCAIYDAQARYLFVNRSLTRFLRLSADQIVGRTDEDLLPAQFTDIYVPLLRRTIENRTAQQGELSFPGPLGTLHFLAHYVPLLDDDGHVREVVGISYDITQQKLVEVELRRRDSEVRTLAENVPDIVARIDREGRHLFVNRQIEAITGLPAAKFLGRTDAELGMPRELVEKWDELRNTVIETGQPIQAEFTGGSPQGPRHFETRFIPELGPDGAIITVLTLTRDISREKIAERNVRDREHRFRQAFEAAPIGISLVDVAGKFLQANNAFCRMLGYAEEELRTLTVADITHPDDLPVSQQAMQTIFDRRLVTAVEKRYIAKHGAVVWGRFTGTALVDPNGQLRFGLGMVEDITASRAAEQELARHREHLEELVRSRTRALEASQQTIRSAERLASLGTLASGIVHEINNPLGEILLAAEMAQAAEVAHDAERLQQCLAAIQAGAQRCSQIVKNVVSFARHETTEKSPSQLNDVVRGAYDRIASYAAARGATISWNLDDALGPLPMNVTGVEQAVVNVLRNAIESRTDGVIIEITTRSVEGYQEVAVCDNGKGISVEIQAHIFDPFFTTRRNVGGTGLGLSIVHGTVTDHRGRVRLSSVAGQGTTLALQLPASL